MTLADRVAILEGGKLMHLATPKEIYNDPANLFVAQFIGAPPMNLLSGTLSGGQFRFDQTQVAAPSAASDDQASLGVRPEDCFVVSSEQGQLRASVYASELLGDHTLVSAAVGDKLITVKASKDFDAPIDTEIGIQFQEGALYLFDQNGERIRG